jgi:glycine cleavage system aminomethyltransferase T
MTQTTNQTIGTPDIAAQSERLNAMDHKNRVQPFNALVRISPYYEATERSGVSTYDMWSHAYVAAEYPVSMEDQYKAVTQGVCIWDTHTERQMQVKGRDAIAFSDTLVCKDLTKLEPGRCTYTFVTDSNGEILVDLVMLIIDEETVWFSHVDADILLWARAHADHSDLDVEVTEPDVSPIQVQGPKSRDTLRDLVEFPLDDLRFFRNVRTKVAGIDAVVSRTGWTNELGFEIYPLGTDRGMELWDAVCVAGEPYEILPGNFNIQRAVEGGLIVVSFASSDQLNPLEHWRDPMVDFDGGPFIGKEALEAIRDSGGPSRKIVGLKSLEASDPFPRLEWKWNLTTADGEWAGRTTWASFSPELECNLAIPLLDVEHTRPGTRLTIHTPVGEEEMEVVPLPFTDPEGLRVRA